MTKYNVMTSHHLEVFQRDQVTEDILEAAARLFSEHYGIWSQAPGAFGKPGSRVKMAAARLRAECLPDGSRSCYARVTVDGTLAGHAFACRWQYGHRQVCWITQLVVHREHRERRLATTLLLALLDRHDDVFGIVSSHAAACKTLARAFGDFPASHPPLEFARQHAAGILAASPVGYIRNAVLRGSLFDGADATGLRCGVDSGFFVDHAEPEEALARTREQSGQPWPLGELPDGHEFLLVFSQRLLGC